MGLSRGADAVDIDRSARLILERVARPDPSPRGQAAGCRLRARATSRRSRVIIARARPTDTGAPRHVAHATNAAYADRHRLRCIVINRAIGRTPPRPYADLLGRGQLLERGGAA